MVSEYKGVVMYLPLAIGTFYFESGMISASELEVWGYWLSLVHCNVKP